MFIALNDCVIPANHDQRATDRGYLLGEGVFETLLVRDAQPQFFDAHLARLRQSAHVVGIDYPNQDMRQLTHDVLHANQLLQGEAVLRITLTRSTQTRGLLVNDCTPQLLITAYLYKRENTQTEASITITPFYVNDRSTFSNYKTTHYMEHIQAKRFAKRRGFDEAILLNTRDRVCCTSIGNLFIWLNQQLITPPLSDGALPGITRQRLIHQCQDSLPVDIRPITQDDLDKADTIFHTNSLIGIQAFSSINHRSLQPLPASLVNVSDHCIHERD
ncbi:MAG: hypothetical protein CL816_04065 [Coxiellaceae bacterium]|nr:hypothetical protein [Coxiellaceae bacterium]